MEDLTAFSSGSREKGGDTGKPKVQGWVGSQERGWPRGGMWPSCWNSLSLFRYDKLHVSYKDLCF